MRHTKLKRTGKKESESFNDKYLNNISSNNLNGLNNNQKSGKKLDVKKEIDDANPEFDFNSFKKYGNKYFRPIKPKEQNSIFNNLHKNNSIHKKCFNNQKPRVKNEQIEKSKLEHERRLRDELERVERNIRFYNDLESRIYSSRPDHFYHLQKNHLDLNFNLNFNVERPFRPRFSGLSHIHHYPLPRYPSYFNYNPQNSLIRKRDLYSPSPSPRDRPYHIMYDDYIASKKKRIN